MQVREPKIECHGPAATHDQSCAVLRGESAVLNLNLGVFEPSWKAQEKGWHLVHARTWLQKLALRLFEA